MIGWAREHNAQAALVQPDLDDGQAVLFDGHIWHGSRNDRSSGTRTALLLQYASADSPIRMHDETSLEWPFTFLPEPRPPMIVVHGTASEDANHLVAPPRPDSREGFPMLSTVVQALDLPLEEELGGGWKPYQLFGGVTPILSHMNCHTSVLSSGHCPHPPHAHHEEELLIILDGEAELIIADSNSWDGARVERVAKGAFAYYPAFQHHTIRNSSGQPLTYLMFKWHGQGARSSANAIGCGIFRYPDDVAGDVSGWLVETVMEGPTGWLSQLHCRKSWLEVGAGYEPHVDAYDVAIIMLSGRIETLGRTVERHGVIYYAAGERHGIRSVGTEPARYLVFEFHPSSIDLTHLLRGRFKPLLKEVLKRTALAIGFDLHRLRGRPSGNV